MTTVANEATADRKPYELWLFAFLLALLFVRLIANTYSQTDLLVNEAQYWSWSRNLAFGYFSKPPLLAWIIHGVSEVCGDGEACLRSFAPFFFTIAAWFVFLTAKGLYDARIGFWSAIVFITLPQVAFLAAAVTPDVPLLLFWTIALYLWTLLLERKSAGLAVLLGLVIGMGLLAKYAMMYFPLCMACQAAFSPDAREALRNRRGLFILLAALVPLAPNFYWNYANDFVSFWQTANSAGWDRPQPFKYFVQFVLSQFLVYGPVLLFMVLWIAGVATRIRTDRRVIMFLAFSLPVLLLITIQAMVGRIHAHWTAVVAPAVSILTVAWLLERQRRTLFGITLVTNALATVVLLIAPALPPHVFPRQHDPFARMQGWKEVADAVRRQLAKGDYAAIAVDNRDLAAELVYYLRESEVPLYYVGNGGEPNNTFDMERPYRPGSPEPVLFASLRQESNHTLEEFKSVEFLAKVTTRGGGRDGRTLHFYKLSGFAPRE